MSETELNIKRRMSELEDAAGGISSQHMFTQMRNLVNQALEARADQPRPAGRRQFRHNNGVICSGTIRVAVADFDTDPAPEVKQQILDELCYGVPEQPCNDTAAAHIATMCGWFESLAIRYGWNRENSNAAWKAHDAARSFINSQPRPAVPDEWPSERKHPLVEVFYQKGDDPFICGFIGNACSIESIENDILSDPLEYPDRFPNGDGIYLFTAYYEAAQIGDEGRTELPEWWDLNLLSYRPLAAQQPEGGEDQ